MNPLTLFLLAAALGTDAALVSFSAALRLPRVSIRQGFRLVFHFGLFQGGMTLLGFWAGSAVRGILSQVDHWIAFFLLAFVGGKMIFESAIMKNEELRDPSRGMLLVTLAVATSIDALAVGIGLALLKVKILAAAITIGLVTSLMCIGAIFAGIHGRRLGKVEKYSALVAGSLLIAIGVKILFDHGVFDSLPI